MQVWLDCSMRVVCKGCSALCEFIWGIHAACGGTIVPSLQKCQSCVLCEAFVSQVGYFIVFTFKTGTLHSPGWPQTYGSPVSATCVL